MPVTSGSLKVLWVCTLTLESASKMTVLCILQLLVTTKECLDAIKKVQDLIAAHRNEDDCAQVDQIYIF